MGKQWLPIQLSQAGKACIVPMCRLVCAVLFIPSQKKYIVKGKRWEITAGGSKSWIGFYTRKEQNFCNSF